MIRLRKGAASISEGFFLEGSLCACVCECRDVSDIYQVDKVGSPVEIPFVWCRYHRGSFEILVHLTNDIPPEKGRRGVQELIHGKRREWARRKKPLNGSLSFLV